MAIKTIKLEAHFVPEIAAKVATETTDGADFERVTAELEKSGAFEYGNGTTTVVTFENLKQSFLNPAVYDTRYVSVSDFKGLVVGLLEERYGENLDYIEEVES